MAFETLFSYGVGLITELGVSVADYIFIMTLIPSALFLATEVRYGLYLMFIIHGFELVFFILWGIPTLKVIIMAFVLLAMMALTLIFRPGAGNGSI